MNKPGPENIKKAAQWAVYAEEDMRYAEHGMKLVPDTPYRLVKRKNAWSQLKKNDIFTTPHVILNEIRGDYQ